jgi:transcriptional regulator with XRE-family HTH domain
MEADWFAGRLRELRAAAGLSRKELAALAGMRSEAGIRDLEQGARKPSWETVIALCKALKVPCDSFTEKPAELPPAAPGRPRKAAGASEAGEGAASGARLPAGQSGAARERPGRKKRG